MIDERFCLPIRLPVDNFVEKSGDLPAKPRETRLPSLSKARLKNMQSL